MTRFLLSLVLGLGLYGSLPRAQGFAMFGQIPTWFTDQTGQWTGGVDIYGPMNLGEEHRWVVPQIIYGFDESFLNYFGARGVEEVEKAIQIINDLPLMDVLNVNDYPTFSMRVNYRARDLQLIDLKSYALKIILEQLGLAPAGRNTFALRVRYTPTGGTNYLVIQRNFDPETWEPTPYVNGQLWTYLDIYENQDDPIVKSSTIPEPVDPLILAEPVASSNPGFAPSLFSFGSYFSGLTRDDVGGLRYIYRPENRNVENLPADATGSAGFATGGGGGTGEWTPITPPSTNTAAGGGAGGGQATPPTVVFYQQGVRGGINRVQFLRGGSGIVLQPTAYLVTNRFDDDVQVVVTNGVERTVSQRVTRLLTQPDILFAATDLATTVADVDILTRTPVATSNDAINGNVGLDGPGQFDGGAVISFAKTGPVFFNIQSFLLYQPVQNSDFVWGSFDGTTNDPVIYPSGTSIRALEQLIFGGR